MFVLFTSFFSCTFAYSMCSLRVLISVQLFEKSFARKVSYENGFEVQLLEKRAQLHEGSLS